MPIYEYQCDDCNHALDALQKVNDKPLVDCPECGKNTLRRLISAPNFRLKGEGWYETDFKKENRKNVVGKEDDKSEKKEDEKSEKKEDNKSEKKEDDKSEKKESSKSDNDSDKTKKKDKIKDKAPKDAE